MPVLPVLYAAILSLVATTVAASTVKDINLTLSYDGESYFDTRILNCDPGQTVDACRASGEVVFDGQDAWLDGADDAWGLPRLFPLFSPGQEISFTARLHSGDLAAGVAGSVSACDLGGYDCRGATWVEFTDDAFDLFYGLNIWFWGGVEVGDQISFRNDSRVLSDAFLALTGTGHLGEWAVWQSNFTVTGTVPPPVAPVPLPAAMYLLPVGLAGFGIFRPGRRKAGRSLPNA